MNEVILKNWVTCYDYKHKDKHFHLSGEVYNDGRFNDGDYIYTSRIVSIIDNIATTKTGTQYYLDFPLMWLYDKPQTSK